MEWIEQFLLEQALILVPVLLVIGLLLKKTPRIADWLIPWLLLALGSIGGLALVSWDINGLLQGILAAGCAVFGHQLVKQAKQRDAAAAPGREAQE